ncbi:MAG: FAD-dependent oxidoreductase [Bacteroidales bacterium]
MKNKKYIVVGGVAGGASAAARIRRLNENAEILILDKGPNISFSNCCLPNYFSGEINSIDNLVLFEPAGFKKMFNLEAKVNQEVIKIEADKHKVIVKDLTNRNVYEESYDYLILSPGAHAIKPTNIKGIDGENVFVVKNVADVRKIDAFAKSNNVTDIVVVGGGFIGVETAECFKKAGKNVTLVEAQDQIMCTFDYDFVQMLHKELYDNGINLILSDCVVEIDKDKVVLSSGREVKATMVIMAIGVKPDIKMAVDSGIEVGETGGIKVDAKFRTNLPDVYAVGDAIEVHNSITKKKTRLPLAGPAQRQARMAADGIFGRTVNNRGVIGSSAIRVFNLNAAVTGLNEEACKKAGIDYMTAYILPFDKVKLLPNPSVLHFKLIFENPTGRILGAQAIGKGNATKRIDVIATMITMGGYLEDLKELELCYAPPFGTAKDVVNVAAMVGLNLLNGEYKQVPMTKITELVENGEYIIDARERDAYQASHVKGSINIPLSEIRQRHNEIPRDRTVYIHCRTSWYSYYSIRALQGYGINNVVNIQGSFLGFSNYLYFNDKTTGRESILTGYNFN